MPDHPLACRVRGEWSAVLPREMAHRLREAIPAARLVEVPGAYHHITLDQPRAFAAILRDALAAGEAVA